MPVHKVDSASFKREVLESEKSVVVDFYADWCGPCHVVAPAIEAISDRWNQTVKFVKVNVDRSPDLAVAYEIQSIPTIMRFDAGEPVARITGAKPRRAIESGLGLGRNGDRIDRSAGRIRDWWSRR